MEKVSPLTPTRISNVFMLAIALLTKISVMLITGGNYIPRAT